MDRFMQDPSRILAKSQRMHQFTKNPSRSFKSPSRISQEPLKMDRLIQDPLKTLAESQTMQLISKSPSRIHQESFKNPSKILQESFRDPWIIQDPLKMDRLMQDPLKILAESQNGQLISKNLSRILQGSFKDPSRIPQGSLKERIESIADQSWWGSTETKWNTRGAAKSQNPRASRRQLVPGGGDNGVNGRQIMRHKEEVQEEG